MLAKEVARRAELHLPRFRVDYEDRVDIPQRYEQVAGIERGRVEFHRQRLDVVQMQRVAGNRRILVADRGQMQQALKPVPG